MPRSSATRLARRELLSSWAMSAISGESSEREPGVGERVRFCLDCGAVLPFDATRCPACGAREPGAATTAGPRRPCPACGVSQPESLLFCSACGAEVGAGAGAIPVAAKGDAARLAQGHPAGRDGAAITRFSVVLALLAPLLLAIVVAELLLGAAPS